MGSRFESHYPCYSYKHLFTVLCLCTYSDKEVSVTVQGPRPDNILLLVHEVIEGLIRESFHGVDYEYLIPCPDCLKESVRGGLGGRNRQEQVVRVVGSSEKIEVRDRDY